MGTPMTGNVVCEPTIPGKRAAPPPAALMILSPRSRAVLAYLSISSGLRWAEIISFSYLIQSSSNVLHVCFIVSQSEILPIMTPTSAILIPPFLTNMTLDALYKQINLFPFINKNVYSPPPHVYIMREDE